jgi:hypothetical protein
MAKRNKAAFTSTEERDIELEVIENPRDENFPRLPNIVSHRGHSLRIFVRVQGTEIPHNATAVKIGAEVITYGVNRIGRNRHVFRHSARWGKFDEKPFPLPKRRKLEYTFELVVEKQLGDDHLGEGPYDAFVTVTPVGEGVVSTTADIIQPKINIRFVSM